MNWRDMTQEQIDRTLGLHRMAYGLLMWLKEQARNNRGLLDAKTVETISTFTTSEDWMRRHLCMVPAHLRPEAEDIPEFSRLFSSFFTTSFRVGQVRWWETVERTLVAGARTFRDGRHQKNSKRREMEAATEMKRLALAALAVQEGIECDPWLIHRALEEETIGHDLSLWTYVLELMRRSHFASQGPSVHRLWLTLDERTRKSLSVEVVWKARRNLLAWLLKEFSHKHETERS